MKKVAESWRKAKRAARAFMQEYNAKGQEIPDSTRNEVALSFRRPKDIHEMIQDALRGERMAQAAHAHGFESFEEANDFDVDEEPDPLSVYQLREMEDEAYDEDRRTHAAERRKGGRKREAVAERKQKEEAGARGAGKRAEPVEATESAGPKDDGAGTEGD